MGPAGQPGKKERESVQRTGGELERARKRENGGGSNVRHLGDTQCAA